MPQVPILGPGNLFRWNRLAGPALVLLAAAVAVAPLLTHGPSCGHDFDFHLISWLEAAKAWRQGIPYPHWAASANFGAGEPRFIFYPPLTWMLGAALGLVLPWTLVPAALTFLLLAGTGMATQALARQFLPEGAATLAGCAAIFSGYALFTAYERTAFGELAGGFWIPLLLLFALRERGVSHPFRTEREMDGAPSIDADPSTTLRSAQDDKALNIWRRALNGSAAPLALVVAGCWLSNLPLGVMACYLLAAVAVAAALLVRSWAPVLRAVLAAVLGLGLTALYLLPAAVEQRWVDVSQATDAPGERIENSWIFARHADAALAEHDTVLLKVSLIAASMIAVALGGVLVVWWRRDLKGHGFSRAANEPINAGALAPEGCSPSEPQLSSSFSEDSTAANERFGAIKTFPPGLKPGVLLAQQSARLKSCPFKTGGWLVLALIPLAVLFLQLPISLPVWNLLPRLRFLQFPWRWLVVLEAPMAIFFAAAVWLVRRWLRVAAAVLCAAFFVAATAFAAKDFYQTCDDQDAVAPMISAYRSGAGFLGADEYAPPGADNALLPSGLPAACLVADPATALGIVPSDADPDEPIPVWDAAQGSCEASANWLLNQPEHKRLAATVAHAGFLVLRLRSYPAWKLRLNGLPIASLPQRDDGLVAIPVAQGPVEVTADWTITPDEIAGHWLSVLGVVLFIALFCVERRLRNSCHSHLS